MAAHNEPAAGTDFWAAIGVAQETEDQPDEKASQDEPVVTGSAASAAPAGSAAGPTTAAGQQKTPDGWAALFSAWEGSANGAPSQQPAAGAPGGRTSGGVTSEGGTTAEAAAGEAQASVPSKKPEAPESPPAQKPAEPRDAPAGPHPPEAAEPAQAPAAPALGSTASTRAPQTAQTAHKHAEAGTSQVPGADQTWITAERIAASLRPRLAEIWLEVLTRHTNGDPVMASKVYNVLNGSHLLGELLRDETIDEVHVHGTRVTVCGAHGVRQVPGFPSLAASRKAIKTVAASRDATGAVVSKVNDSVVISRANGTGPNTNALVTGGVVTGEQVAQIRRSVERMQAVTVTGPAARIVVRALASLIPEGSRVFLGAYAALPAGCLTAASPMEADYVLGVRPGTVAEEMAAAGQVGALIANPETAFPAALRFTVTGQSAAPEKLIAH